MCIRDSGDDGQPHALGKLHLTQRFAVAFGVRTAEVALQAFLRRTALTVPYEHESPFADTPEAGHDRRVVAVGFVPVQLDEIVESFTDVVPSDRSIGMPRHRDLVPRRNALVRVGEPLAELAPEGFDLGGDIQVGTGLSSRSASLRSISWMSRSKGRPAGIAAGAWAAGSAAPSVGAV